MGSKKKRDSKVTVESRTEAVQPIKTDMSKYARAYSNKSKINYADLKLVRPAQTKSPESSEPEKINKQESKSQEAGADKKTKKTKDRKNKKTKPEKEQNNKSGAAKNNDTGRKSEANSSGMTAEERYSNALGKEDHYSSAVEKYYLKYPDKKRPKKSAASRRVQEQQKKKKKRSSNSGAAGNSKRSMAEIAVKNKGTSSVKEHARAARNAKARGVISPTVANRTFYRHKKKRSGALNVLMITLLLVFLASVGVTVFFNVRTITVKGENPYGDARIKSVCSIRKGSNILFLSADEIEKKVEKELPYISECQIERKLPSSVVINVKKADVLGVAQSSTGHWSVISTDGKLLESSESKADTSEENQAETPPATPDYNSASEIAESRKLPLLLGLDIMLNRKDGFITDEKQLGYIGKFTLIKKAFENQKMKLTAIKYGDRDYEAVYDNRITVIFGKEIDAKTIAFRLKEMYALIHEEGYISENSRGELRFSKNNVFFRPEYEVSEEEVERIREQRRETNRKRLYELAEIFMTTGDDWFKGKIKIE